MTMETILNHDIHLSSSINIGFQFKFHYSKCSYGKFETYHMISLKEYADSFLNIVQSVIGTVVWK